MSPPLLRLMVERIRADGPMTVADFCDLALYHPEHGYYASAVQRSGRSGDFVTSVDVGPLFGRLLAVQVAEMYDALDQDRLPDPPRATDPASGFDLVEAAAGNGRLARDVLDALESQHPRALAALHLHLVERSAPARAAQRGVLGPHASRLATSGPDVPERVTGVILANELLDALPPHLVVRREVGLREVFVDEAGGALVTRELPPSTVGLQRYLDEVGADLAPGSFGEVNLAAVAWVRGAARRLACGFLVLIDYGHEASRLYSGAHPNGTLESYRRHVAGSTRPGPTWLEDPGSRDITSHVDLTGVRHAAESEGLTLIGATDQTYFLLALAAGATPPVDALQDRLALKTLSMPGGLGSSHKVLVFSKGIEPPRLTGLSMPRLT